MTNYLDESRDITGCQGCEFFRLHIFMFKKKREGRWNNHEV